MTDAERIKAALDLHTHAYKVVEYWAKGYPYTGDHCAYDGQHWPCDTAVALGVPVE